MADEIVFLNAQNEEVFLPESVGKGLGLRKATDFVPKEAGDNAKQQNATSTAPKKPTFNQAVSLIREFMDTATDEEKQPERLDELTTLGNELLQYTGHDFETGNTEQTGEPSLVDAITVVEKFVDSDKGKTPAQKKKLKEHLQELLNAQDTDTPPAE